MDRFVIDRENKRDLQTRFDVEFEAYVNSNLNYVSTFDGMSFGEMSVIHHQPWSGVPYLVWDRFFPFGQTYKPDYRSELLKTGLGTLAHTLVIMRVISLLQNPDQYLIKHQSPETLRERQLERIGVQDAIKNRVSLRPYAAKCLLACKEIGFEMEEFQQAFRLHFANALD
ncbi:MAG: hypothetical protein HOO67_01420 [Candidatus Peribacteraceae bacterium]|nr:hypothetical protein [Candidatus Peribacteraceae bacterium]